MTTERKLFAFINSKPVGVLIDRNGVWSFQYDEKWIDDKGYPLAPSFPLMKEEIIDDSNVRPVQNFFDNLLPEEAARQLMAKDAKVDVTDRFALLTHYGAESAGAITLLSGATAPEPQNEFQELTDEELSARIKNLPASSLTQDAPKRMSLAGAQHKLAVCYDPLTQELTEPVGDTPSSFILKPNHTDPDNYPHSVINEWFIMELAKHTGLEVPDVHYLKVPEPVYLIKRFDRIKTSTTPLRVHTIDACQLLQIAPESKYWDCTLERLIEISEKCNAPALTRRTIFKWLVFNFLVGNNDAHLKNLSFFVYAEGFELSPFYDLLSASCYANAPGQWLKSDMVTALNGKKTYTEITLEDLEEVGHQLRVGTSKSIKKQILDLSIKVVATANSLYESLEQENSDKPGRLKLTTGEFHQLRTIITGHIKEASSTITTAAAD